MIELKTLGGKKSETRKTEINYTCESDLRTEPKTLSEKECVVGVDSFKGVDCPAE